MKYLALLFILTSLSSHAEVFRDEIYNGNIDNCIRRVKKNLFIYEKTENMTCRADLPQINNAETICWIKATCRRNRR